MRTLRLGLIVIALGAGSAWAAVEPTVPSAGEGTSEPTGTEPKNDYVITITTGSA